MVEMLVSIIKKRQFKWSGHATRQKDSLPLANNIMHGRAPGKRGRGRPRVTWIQNIRNCTGVVGNRGSHGSSRQNRLGKRVEDSKVLLPS